jgi:mRNA-degrading endonuclease YafQ of YafQ-DinJ toxin-antitoxin module
MPARDRRETDERALAVKRLLLRSTAVMRAAQHVLNKHPQLADDLRTTLEQLSEDASHPKLRTHKLKGKLENCWACFAGYDRRTVFRFVPHEGSEAVLPETAEVMRKFIDAFAGSRQVPCPCGALLPGFFVASLPPCGAP